MKQYRLLAGLAALALIATASAADLYKWTDEKGQVHYTSSPPPETARKPQQIDPANPSNATALPASAAASGAANAPGVLFILDASGSMKAKIDNREKIVIAKEVMSNLLRDLPATIQVGLEVYGHHTKGDCNDIEVMAPVGQTDKAALIQRIQAIDPKGMTPITQALQVAAEQLKTAEQETTVVLVSDGEETCKGDPCAAVGSLVQQGVKLKVHVVGFDVAEKEQQQLMCIAKAGNGRYFTANNAEQLKDALTEVKQEVVKKVELPPPPPVVAQTPPSPAPEKKVVKMPALGTIKIPKYTGRVPVYDQNRKEVDYFGGTAHELILPAGTYKLEFSGVPLEIQVDGGKTTEISSQLGTIKIPKYTGRVPVYDQNGKEVDYFGGTAHELILPAGTYKLEFSGAPLEIQVEGGQEVVLE
ncbi:MAG: VWA domain-containing protein [Candidatus Contendobacter sp.]|nr:VWA domain-containing protein [Candidatus Contendobacter sp.]